MAGEEEFWSAVEEIAEETLRGYRWVVPAGVLEEMRVALVITLGAHPEVEPLVREVVRRQRIREGDGEEGLDERGRV